MRNLVLGSVVAVSSLFALTACANVGAATDNTPRYKTMPQGQMQAQRQNMMSELNLTATQQAQMQAIRQNNRGNRAQNHEAMMQILTTAQRQQVQQMQAQRMSQGGRMMNQGRGGHHMSQGQGGRMMNQSQGGRMMNQGQGGRMMNQGPWSQLNLTADQQAKIQAIRQNNRGNRTQNHNAIMQVLTPEQRQKLQQMQSQYMNQGGRMMNQGQN